MVVRSFLSPSQPTEAVNTLCQCIMCSYVNMHTKSLECSRVFHNNKAHKSSVLGPASSVSGMPSVTGEHLRHSGYVFTIAQAHTLACHNLKLLACHELTLIWPLPLSLPLQRSCPSMCVCPGPIPPSGRGGSSCTTVARALPLPHPLAHSLLLSIFPFPTSTPLSFPPHGLSVAVFPAWFLVCDALKF